MVMKRILITDVVHECLIDGLTAAGYGVDYHPTITAAEVENSMAPYFGLIINSKVFVGKKILDAAPNLKFVCRAGSGLEVIDLAYAKEKGVLTFNSPEGNRNAVAEHALGMLLNVMNNISRAHEQVKSGVWKREENRGNELSGKTIGLIAYGNTAQALAKLLLGFDVKVLAYDKYLTGFGNQFVNEVSLQLIYEQADIVSVHLPLTEETHHIIDYAFFAQFKKPIWFINTSRGKVMNTADLLRALLDHKVIGATLDVLENENLASWSDEEKQLLQSLVLTNRVLFSPHIAGWTHESKRKIGEVLLRKILDLSF
jgi:D-3-phosphoglycerate dehydrogenase